MRVAVVHAGASGSSTAVVGAPWKVILKDSTTTKGLRMDIYKRAFCGCLRPTCFAERMHTHCEFDVSSVYTD